MMLQSVVGGYDLYPDYDYMYIRNVDMYNSDNSQTLTLLI